MLMRFSGAFQNFSLSVHESKGPEKICQLPRIQSLAARFLQHNGEIT